jgi:hypothetical protein
LERHWSCYSRVLKLNTVIYRRQNVTLFNHVIEGMVEGSTEVAGRRGIRFKQLPDGLKETRGYWNFKEEALERTLGRTRLGSGCGFVIRQNTV